MLQNIFEQPWMQAMFKGFAAAILTLFVYQFFYIEFIRASIEDSAFDSTSWFALSKTTTETNSSNTFVLLLDDKYLKSKNLLDENNETNYGYLLPRIYLAQIISEIDAFVEEVDKENKPRALFLDYDFSYLSDPHNKVATEDDLKFLEALKHQRDYIIYLPITSNYNFIYHSKDSEIQALIEAKKIRFVSVGLTTASDNISRRYYPYEVYNDRDNKEREFPHIAIELYNNGSMNDENISKSFSQDGISLIENRIIFKDSKILESKEYDFWQSNWAKLSIMSANYPLDMIYEEDLKDAMLMVGAAHSASNDNFEIDAYSKEISGIEMHANALMTLYYLDGKLKRLPIVWNMLIIFLVVSIIEYFVILFQNSNLYQRLCVYKKSMRYEYMQDFFSMIIPDDKEEFGDLWLVATSIIILYFISYYFLVSSEHYWFNWMIPAMMAVPYLVIMSIKKVITK